MNKVILMGRLTRDPEVRYSQGATPMAVARYSLAVNRRFKRDETDFINCVAFGKTGEFAEKYLKKGQMISIVGSLRTGSYDDKDGKKVRTTDVVVDEHFFAESKGSYESNRNSAPATGDSTQAKQPAQADGFYPIDESMEDDDLPF